MNKKKKTTDQQSNNSKPSQIKQSTKDKLIEDASFVGSMFVVLLILQEIANMAK